MQASCADLTLKNCNYEEIFLLLLDQNSNHAHPVRLGSCVVSAHFAQGLDEIV